MIKTFCDVCEKEIDRNWVTQRLVRYFAIPHKVSVEVEIIVKIDGVWNDGAICEGCLMTAIVEGEEA